MTLTEKAKIFKNIWCCAFQRRYAAKLKGDWELYDREHQTLLMCLNMKDANDALKALQSFSDPYQGAVDIKEPIWKRKVRS